VRPNPFRTASVKNSASPIQSRTIRFMPCRAIFYKDTANREQKTQTRLKVYAEMPRIFYKDTI